MDAIKSYSGDVSLLGKAEQYMVEMVDVVPAAKKRIEAMNYKTMFKSRVNELKQCISIIENACDDVKLSLKFKKVLKAILKVGNTLNTDEAHNEKQLAFSIESLLKLQAAKAFDNKTTVLQYVIMVVNKNDPSIASFTDELSHVPEASKYTFEIINAEKSALIAGLESVRKIVAEIVGTDGNVADEKHTAAPMVQFIGLV